MTKVFPEAFSPLLSGLQTVDLRKVNDLHESFLFIKVLVSGHKSHLSSIKAQFIYCPWFLLVHFARPTFWHGMFLSPYSLSSLLRFILNTSSWCLDTRTPELISTSYSIFCFMTLVRKCPSAVFQLLRFNDLLLYSRNNNKKIYCLSAKLTCLYYSPISPSSFQWGQSQYD